MSFFDKLTGIKTEEEKSGAKKQTKKKKVAAPEGGEPRPEKSGRELEKPKSEGQLSIDVYETNGDFIIQSTIAGVKAEDLDIAVENDLVTIRGSRQRASGEEGKNYFYQECYWGGFARKVILPQEVDGSRAEAKVKDGILTLTIPKIQKTKKKKVSVKQEE